MTEDDLFKILKDCYTGKAFLGVVSRYYQGMTTFNYKSEGSWASKMGTYKIIVDDDEGDIITYSSFVVYPSGESTVISKNKRTNKKYLKDEIFNGHLVEFKKA